MISLKQDWKLHLFIFRRRRGKLIEKIRWSMGSNHKFISIYIFYVRKYWWVLGRFMQYSIFCCCCRQTINIELKEVNMSPLYSQDGVQSPSFDFFGRSSNDKCATLALVMAVRANATIWSFTTLSSSGTFEVISLSRPLLYIEIGLRYDKRLRQENDSPHKGTPGCSLRSIFLGSPSFFPFFYGPKEAL